MIQVPFNEIEKLPMDVLDLYLLQQKVNELIDFCNHIVLPPDRILLPNTEPGIAPPCSPAPEPDVAPDIHVPAITCSGYGGV